MLSKISTRNIILFFGMVSLLIYMSFPIAQQGKSIPMFMIIYAIEFILCFGLFYLLREKDVERGDIKLIILFAVLFRIVLVPSNISTSDDVYRYIWEGKVVAHGENPFLYPPDSKELLPLHSKDFPEKVTYPHMTSIYPGAAQSVFALGYLISGENDTGLKLLYLLAEFITMLFLFKLLGNYKIPERNIILYAWLPLPIMEFFINSHIDVIGLMFFIISLYLIEEEKLHIGAFLFGLAISIKPYAMIMLPFIVLYKGWKKGLLFGIVSVFVFVLSMLPFLSAGEKIFSSFMAYSSSWSFNGSIYSLVSLITKNGYTAHAISFVLLAGGLIFLFVYTKSSWKYLFYSWVIYIAFMPTIFPWYLCWIAILIPFVPHSAVIIFLFLINLSNFSPLQTEWKEFTWVYLLEYIPFFGLLLYGWLTKKDYFSRLKIGYENSDE